MYTCVCICVHQYTFICFYLFRQTERHTHTQTHLYTNTFINRQMGGARCVMVIVAGNGYDDTSSNPGRD